MTPDKLEEMLIGLAGQVTSLHAAVDRAATQETEVARMGKDVHELKSAVARVEKLLTGNGQPGLVSQMSSLRESSERRLDALQAAHDSCPARIARTMESRSLAAKFAGNWIAFLALLVAAITLMLQTMDSKREVERMRERMRMEQPSTRIPAEPGSES